MNDKAHRRQRLKLCERIIRPVLFYGAGNWICTQRSREKLKTLQLQMYRKIMRTWRKPTETREQYFRRTARQARFEMNEIQVNEWHDEVDWIYWKWMGHVGRKNDDTMEKAILNELNILSDTKVTSLDKLRKYLGANWVSQTVRRNDWREMYDPKVFRMKQNQQPISIIRTRAQIDRDDEIAPAQTETGMTLRERIYYRYDVIQQEQNNAASLRGSHRR